MSFDDDGKMTLFADLEKITEKQKERARRFKGKTVHRRRKNRKKKDRNC